MQTGLASSNCDYKYQLTFLLSTLNEWITSANADAVSVSSNCFHDTGTDAIHRSPLLMPAAVIWAPSMKNAKASACPVDNHDHR